jgi:hypothetical protein
MTSPDARIRRIGPVIGLILIVAACGPSTGSGTPVATATKAPPSVTGSIPNPTAPSSGPKTLQTDTAWGRIWDGLPSGFPSYPGATPDEEASGGPASAVFVVEGHSAKDVAAFLRTELQKAGYTAVGSTEPLEDGSVVLDMTGSPDGCMLQVTVKPTGGLISVTVLYGAACPLA